MDNIDRNKKITHRLYRQHTTPHYDYAIKDLKNLGRNLTRTIIIDNMAENFNSTTPLWINSSKLDDDLENHWEVLAEPIQMLMRKHGIKNPYEILKEKTRG